MVKEYFIKQLLNKTKQEAIQICVDFGYYVRIASEDKEIFFGHTNIDFNRINLYIEKNIVTAADIG